jgi:hypothetical protein
MSQQAGSTERLLENEGTSGFTSSTTNTSPPGQFSDKVVLSDEEQVEETTQEKEAPVEGPDGSDRGKMREDH